MLCPEVAVTKRGQVKILDFGLAKLVSGVLGWSQDLEESLTHEGVNPGTTPYMSPEQIRGDELDPRSDLFSFGVVLYQMATGRRPFAGKSAVATIEAILHSAPVSPRDLNPQIPEDLANIIGRALQKDRDLRYQHASEVCADLRRLQRVTETSGTTFLPASFSRTRPGRNRAILGSSIAVLMVALLAFTFSFLAGRHQSINSLAILPFVNTTKEPATEYLADGLTESLIGSLSQLQTLTVRSRSSVFRYKGKDTDPQLAARDLKVQAIVSGRVTQAGDKLLISAELTDIRTNRNLWSEQFDRKVVDALAVEQEIAAEITAHLRQRLTGEEKAQLNRGETSNPEAYQLYLKGRYFWNKWTPQGFNAATEYFRQAIDKDPGYGLAYTGLADTYTSLAYIGELAPADAMPSAKSAALKALEIDERLAEAHVSLAFTETVYDWDWAPAGEHFERALTLNPSYSVAHQWYPYYLDALGRSDQALHEGKRGLELDPASIVMSAAMGYHFYYARRFEEAIEQLRNTSEMDPSYPAAHMGLGLTYAAEGLYAKALPEFEKYEQAYGGTPRSLAYLAYAHACLKERRQALVLLDRLLELSHRRYVSSAYFATVYVGLGEKDQAFSWLQKAVDERSSTLYLLKVDPIWDPLRGDPRWLDLVKRISGST